MKTAQYWHVTENAIVQCDLCPHECKIAPGKTGVCGVRENHGGTLVALNYFVASSISVDPIEKKPLYHFFPGSEILSLGTFGCNFSCKGCQNYTISNEFSRSSLESPNFSAKELIAQMVQLAHGKSMQEFCGVSYTYSEPTVWAETVRELGPLVRQHKLKNVFVTNGFINPKPLDDLLEFADALNIDLKAFDDKFYRAYCSARLDPVLHTIKTAAAHAHVELTTLVIPTLNDTDEQFVALRDWIAAELGADVPVHLSRYFPAYKMSLPPTPVMTLCRGRDILKEKLHYVYLGNIGEEQDTLCAYCGVLVVKRRGYVTQRVGLDTKGACAKCGKAIICSS